MNFTLYQYKYISKDDSTYLKGFGHSHYDMSACIWFTGC